MLLLNRQRVRYWRNSVELDTQCHSRASILAGEDTPSTREVLWGAQRAFRWPSGKGEWLHEHLLGSRSSGCVHVAVAVRVERRAFQGKETKRLQVQGKHKSLLMTRKGRTDERNQREGNKATSWRVPSAALRRSQLYPTDMKLMEMLETKTQPDK